MFKKIWLGMIGGGMVGLFVFRYLGFISKGWQIFLVIVLAGTWGWYSTIIYRKLFE